MSERDHTVIVWNAAALDFKGQTIHPEIRGK
jgi:hypothetical protein